MVPLFISDVPLECINSAALEFHIPAKLIISVLNVEHGKSGQRSMNKNGTYDLGPMQINSSWWPELYQYNISPNQVLYDPCININVGVWILSKKIANGHDLLVGIGNYNSTSLQYNLRYLQNVKSKYILLNQLLQLSRFNMKLSNNTKFDQKV